ARCNRRSKATRAGSGGWPSRATAGCWRRPQTTGPYGSGTLPRARCNRRSKDIRERSTQWPSRATAY
ncbi:MAG: hypothetical protein M1838_002432, partial [Thelocarpon superellum]